MINSVSIRCAAAVFFSSIVLPAFSSNDDAYIKSLREKFGSRIEYKSAEAAAIVNGFNINCKSKDGRYLPLRNVLLAKLREASTKDVWMQTIIEGRAGEVRIYDYLRNKTGKLTSPELIFQISSRGELKPVQIRAEALMNACFGSYGPIWEGAPKDITSNQRTPEKVETRRLVSTPRGFEEKAKTDPVGACAWKLAVLKDAPSNGIEAARLQKDEYCSSLTEEDLRNAEASAEQILAGRK